MWNHKIVSFDFVQMTSIDVWKVQSKHMSSNIHPCPLYMASNDKHKFHN
jgi:hypothetical protein